MNKKLKKELKEKNRIIKILEVNILILTLAIVLFLYLFSQFYIKQDKQVIINYNDLNESQREISENIIKDLKPEYLNVQKSITFTNNLSNYYKKRFYQSQKDYNYELNILLGFNTNRDIYVLYSEDTFELKAILCHELLHSYFDKTVQSHNVIYDLDIFLVCYNSTKVRYIGEINGK
jgi:hypothetical protein